MASGQPQAASNSAYSALEYRCSGETAWSSSTAIVHHRRHRLGLHRLPFAETRMGMGMGDGMSMGMAMADMRSWSAADFGLMYRHVGGDDGGHDGAIGRPHAADVRFPQPEAPGARGALRANRRIPCRVRHRLGRDSRWPPPLGNWGLHEASLLSSMMGASTSGYLGGASAARAAGAFQWSPLKYNCLKQCRTPMGFLMTSWRRRPREGRSAWGWSTAPTASAAAGP